MVQRDSVQLRLSSRDQGIRSRSSPTRCCRRTTSWSCSTASAAGCRSAAATSGATSSMARSHPPPARREGARAHAGARHQVGRRKFGKSRARQRLARREAHEPVPFHQFWLNVDDADAVRYLRYFTFVELGRDRRDRARARCGSRHSAPRSARWPTRHGLMPRRALRSRPRSAPPRCSSRAATCARCPRRTRGRLARGPSHGLPARELGRRLDLPRRAGALRARQVQGRSADAHPEGAVSVNQRGRAATRSACSRPPTCWPDASSVIRRGKKTSA